MVLFTYLTSIINIFMFLCLFKIMSIIHRISDFLNIIVYSLFVYPILSLGILSITGIIALFSGYTSILKTIIIYTYSLLFLSALYVTRESNIKQAWVILKNESFLIFISVLLLILSIFILRKINTEYIIKRVGQ